MWVDCDEVICPYGYKLNPNGQGCLPDIPCDGDPIINMEISDFNKGKDSNRYG
jgi:hypothetical protein